jgi:hypothetical protein
MEAVEWFYLVQCDKFIAAHKKSTVWPSLRRKLICTIVALPAALSSHSTTYHLVWATDLLLAAIGLIFPVLVLGYYFFIVESMTYQFFYRLKNLYDYHWQQ